MKTEITRQYKSGFVLTEQELRRIMQAATEHAEKVSGGQGYSASLEALLIDGSIINLDKADELFELENAGQKKIKKISFFLKSDAASSSPWDLQLVFQDGQLNEDDWTSVFLKICGSSRDWAFVTASDLEDRIKRVKGISFEALFESKWASLWLMIATMASMIFFMSLFPPTSEVHVLLKKQYEAGQIKDGVQAIIELERLRAEQSLFKALWPMVLGGSLPLLLTMVVSFLCPKVFPSYNFCWGDYVTTYQRKKQIQNIILTVVILGLLVAIAANFFSKKLGI